MENYSIICKTDPYHASRMSGFNRVGVKVMDSGLTLKEAQKKLLKYFSEDAGSYFDNWGLAVLYRGKQDLEACKTYRDGTRAYSYDIYTYSIELNF